MRTFRAVTSFITAMAILSVCVFAESNGAFEYFDNVKTDVQKNYRFDTNDAEMYKKALEKVLNKYPDAINEAFDGMMNTMDRHTTFMDKQELQDWANSLSGKFAGIGVQVEERAGYVVVIEPMEGSPAEEVGLKKGDKIVSVDGNDAYGIGLQKVRGMIIGEIGTEVKIGISRESQAETLYFQIKRSLVNSQTVKHRIIEGENVGYLLITEFAGNTTELTKEALADFDSKGIKRIIIDLRNNPGGIRDVAVELAELFVPKGPVMYIEYKDPSKNEIFYSNNQSPKYTLAVLVNRYSASASELLSGTIKDTKMGAIVGETTYGKGTMQTMDRLWSGGALKLTVATYLTAGRNEVNGIGVKPDYEVKNLIQKLNVDPQYEPMSFSNEINENSPEKAIVAIEQRLRVLGYDIGEKPDGKFDSRTIMALKTFQQEHEMESTGKADIITQIGIDNATYDINILTDNQFEKALEIVKTLPLR